MYHLWMFSYYHSKAVVETDHMACKIYNIYSLDLQRKGLPTNPWSNQHYIQSQHKNPLLKIFQFRDFPGGLVVKNPPSNAGDAGLIPGWGTKIPHAAGQLSPCALQPSGHN